MFIKSQKKACLKVKEADDDKEASNDKNAGNKDASPPAPTITVSLGLFAPVTAFLSLLAPVTAFLGPPAPNTASPGLLTPGSVNPSPASTMDIFEAICLSLLSFSVWLFPYSFSAYHTTPISPPLMWVFRSISLSLKNTYAVQHLVSLLGTFRKQLRQDIDGDNRKKLQNQPVAATREEETVRFLFSSCLYTPMVKLNIE